MISNYQKKFLIDILMPAFLSTFKMVFLTSIMATVLGFLVSIILIITGNKRLKYNRLVYNFLGFITNSIRSFPFVILMIFLMPLTKKIAGTSFGVKAALVPLTISATAFIGRLFESSMKEVDDNLIEAMQSFGISDFDLIFGVIVSESIPSILSDVIIAAVAILGSTAMAGTMGAGGVGAVAVTYGYQSFNKKVMYITSIILILFVEFIQQVGEILYSKVK